MLADDAAPRGASEPLLRVLFIVPDLRVGGAERHVATLLEKMNPSRFEASVVCIGEEGQFFADIKRAGIAATALNLGGNKNAPRALSRLVAIMRRDRPDVVVMHAFNAVTLGRIAAKIAGIKKTVVWLHFFGEVEPRNWLYATVDRALTPSTTAFFGVAEVQRRYLDEEFGYPATKIRIIHNGVDPASFSTEDDRSTLADIGISDSDRVVGIVAMLRAEKDHPNLLQAARIVVGEMPNVHFVLIGDGVNRGDLEVLASDLGIAKNVHFLGTRNDIGSLLQGFDVFTLSSKIGECFPIALLEAMACGRPAVCTDVGGIGEIISDGETGFLVPPRNPEALAARLQELLSDPDLARRMGRAARRRLEEEFTLERSVREAERAITEVVLG